MSRVLIVEDELLVARSIAKLLALHGHEVPACLATGPDAVAAARAMAPDLVLMDIHLRGPFDGIEAARRIRETADVPIVFLTAYADREHLERAKLSEPHAYLLKPYSDRELLTTIEVVVHKHKLEREVRARERWFGTTLKSIGDGVIAVDVDRRIELLNRVAEQLTGWSHDEAVGKPLSEVFRLIREDTREPLELPVADALQDGAVRGPSVGTVLCARNGAERPIDASVAAIADEGRGVLGGVVVFRDVSERRALESRVSLTERMSSFATLTAGLGHELNNPLSYNLGNLDLVLSRWLPRLIERVQKNGEPLGAVVSDLREIEARLADAREGAERMRDVLGTLRTFAQPGGTPEQSVAMVDAVDAAIRLTQNQLAYRAALSREVRAAPRVRIHPGQLTQIVAHLLANAAQSIPDDAPPGRPIRLVVDATDDHAVLEVTDSGVGIPPEVMVRIFEPFFTTRPVGMGSGLGLSIVHALVRAHHGDIDAVSKVGEGSTFRVRLPRERTEPPPMRTGVPAVPTSGARRRVLVVDDDPVVARMLGRLIETQHDVVVVASGRDALARLGEERFDLVLTDLMMPEMTGVELHTHLSAHHPEHAQRMLFVTGGAFTPATQAFVEKMGDRVLLKPIRPAALLAAIRVASGS